MKNAIVLASILVVVMSVSLLAKPIQETTWEEASNLLSKGATVREYFQAVDPEMLSRIPAKFHGEPIKPASQTAGAFRTMGKPEKERVDEIIVSCTGRTTAKSGSRCYFGVSSTVIIPLFFRLPYMSIIGQLFGPGGMWGSFTSSGTNKWRVTKNSTISVQGSSNYATTGIHFMEYPPGFFPPTEVVYSQTAWVYVP